MKILTRLGIYFYTTVIFLIGTVMIGFATGYIDANQVNIFLQSLDSFNAKLATGMVGFLLILISFAFGQVMFSRIKREKTIAFQTANGEVLVSLSAVEDLIRKITVDVEGIREARPNVIASKKGIEINLRLALNAEVNIPEFTGSIQEMIRGRVQEILGIDEAIMVKIYVTKIVAKELKPGKGKQEEETPVPFRGYKR